jgi:hypothetical protein
MIAPLYVLAVMVVPGALGGSSAKAFDWPDSTNCWRALVNVNQYIESYVKRHPQWFSRDRLVTDFAVHHVVDERSAAQEYTRVRKLLESKKMYVGTYVSGTSVMPESKLTKYPRETVSFEQMPSTAHYSRSDAKEAERRTIDVSNAETRHALEANIRQLWERFPAPVRFIDNMPPHPKVYRMQPWRVSCEYMAELARIGQRVGSRLVFNIPMSVGEMSDQETRELIEAVGQNGIALEMPWTDVIRRNPDATKRAERRYRELLDTGMAIVMIPVNTPEDELANWVRSWRKPADHLYIAYPFFKPPDASAYALR